MVEAKIEERVLRESVSKGLPDFFEAVAKAVSTEINDCITQEAMAAMNTEQITLLAYKLLRDEVMSGGFIQLIHNGYGAFIFLNPFAKAMREWKISGVSKLVDRAHRLYTRHHCDIEEDMGFDEFMALYEEYPEFEALDDEFVENEERFTASVARYIDRHLEDFVVVVNGEDAPDFA